jgi:cobalt-zinc-cadmium efflux system membrane fusion protein
MRIGALVAAMLAAAALAACSPDDNSSTNVPSNVTLTKDQLQHIRVVTVGFSEFHKTVDANGIVDFDNDRSTAILAPISGPVSRILVDLGRRVRKGEALAEVESPDYATAVTTYRKTDAAARNARRLADLDKDLFAHSSISAREASQAESDAVGAESDRDAARQALVALDLDPVAIRDVVAGRQVSHIVGTIRAPMAGTVVERQITPGTLLTAGTTPCFTVAELSRVWVMAQIFGSDLEHVHVGDPVTISTGIGGSPVAGTVDNVGSVVDPDTRSVAVRVVADNPQGLLKKQMYVRVTIQDRQSARGFLLPVSAILRDDENLPFVYVEQKDGSFARRHVTPGYRSGDETEIESGLKQGERIVADGAIFLQFMQSQ